MREIPDTWIITTLEEIMVKNNPSIIPVKTPDSFFELYSVPSYDEKKPEIVTGKEIGSNKQVVEENDVLLCKINPRINRVLVVGNYSDHLKIASTEWIPFKHISGIYPKYLEYYMKQNSFINYLILNVSGVGGSLMRTNSAKVGRYDFSLPPFNDKISLY